eukprot:SAG31_NODE_33609_length_342_cov_0.547325_1_plen_43_part_00
MVWDDTVIDGVAAEETKANPACGADVQVRQLSSAQMSNSRLL